MARNHPKESENIYRTCRIAANEKAGDGRLSNHDKAGAALAEAGHPVSGSSIKDYESGKTPVPPETVLKMAEVYGAPRLKYLHCAQNCPLGPHVVEAIPEDQEGIYKTFFDLEGAVDEMESVTGELRQIIQDGKLSEGEEPSMARIFAVLEEIIESTRELRIWMESEGAAQAAE